MEPGTKLGHYEILAALGAGGRSSVRLGRCYSLAALLLAILITASCTGLDPGPSPLNAELPLHLEDHLDAATIVGSDIPPDVPATVEWRFDEPPPEWKVAVSPDPSWHPLEATHTEDTLRLSLTEATRRVFPWGRSVYGGVYIDLPDWQREDWAYVLVQARTSAKNPSVAVQFNLREEAGPTLFEQFPFRFFGEFADMVNDGTVQTYRLRADWSGGTWQGPWRQLGLTFAASEPAGIDLLSVRVIPKEANYAAASAGVQPETRNRAYRRALYIHAPGRVDYRVQVPEAGRLDVGLGVLRDDAPVTFRITAAPAGGQAESLLEETYADKERWDDRSVDLSHLAGRTVTLQLEAEAERAGTVALWAAPTVSGSRTTDRPNIVFYVIDGAAADLMSVYGYNRRTTPYLERLAAEGAVFEHAYSNSSWTKPSTASFMTSLQHSVLGGYKTQSDPLPDQAMTMAQHLHRAHYQTAVFVANPNAGTLSNLQRGVDLLREDWVEFSYLGGENHAESSRFLHEAFCKWREAYPAEPYWVHFQTTDVHQPWRPVAPFAGLYVGLDVGQRVNEWRQQLDAASGGGQWWTRFDNTDISRIEFYDGARGLYDEGMAHNDYQIGRLVERLKAAGEWERTLFIVVADHSHGAAGLPQLDPPAPPWSGPNFSSWITRIPMIVVWPERIAPGQRFSEPVSMIDMLPTILDLAGLPMPEVMQGQSLAPLLRGEEGFQPRPVIFDEFNVDWDTGELRGSIELIDGRWGASLEINPSPEDEEQPAEARRAAPLLLYDLWNDPYCLNSLHAEHPDLVEKYTALLEAQWGAHQALAQQFTQGGEIPLTPEQLRALRALGYIQ